MIFVCLTEELSCTLTDEKQILKDAWLLMHEGKRFVWVVIAGGVVCFLCPEKYLTPHRDKSFVCFLGILERGKTLDASSKHKRRKVDRLQCGYHQRFVTAIRMWQEECATHECKMQCNRCWRVERVTCVLCCYEIAIVVLCFVDVDSLLDTYADFCLKRLQSCVKAIEFVIFDYSSTQNRKKLLRRQRRNEHVCRTDVCLSHFFWKKRQKKSFIELIHERG